jgi:hypothetical protein
MIVLAGKFFPFALEIEILGHYITGERKKKML